MLSSNLPMVSRRLVLARSIASSLTSTASILVTMLPIEFSMRSTRRWSRMNSSLVAPTPSPPSPSSSSPALARAPSISLYSLPRANCRTSNGVYKSIFLVTNIAYVGSENEIPCSSLPLRCLDRPQCPLCFIFTHEN